MMKKCRYRILGTGKGDYLAGHSMQKRSMKLLCRKSITVHKDRITSEFQHVCTVS